MTRRSITDADVQRQRVLCRVDFNVPLRDGAIQDDSRIRAAVSTIEWLVSHGARVILCSHLGRPKGKVVDDLRLKPVADRLADLLGIPVTSLEAITGPDVTGAVGSMADSEVVLLENLRFDPREETNDPSLARELADLADLYVNDAFGAAHRAHASTEGVTHLIPAYIGLLMRAEIEALTKLLTGPEHPFVAIVGGAKVSDKMGVLENLLPRVDTVLIGGGMANTFLLAQGVEVGTSLIEADLVTTASGLIAAAQAQGVEIGLPTDVVVARSIDASAGDQVHIDSIGDDAAIFDIGSETAAQYADVIAGARTVLWNGPLGVAENPAFAEGTATVARAVAAADGYTVIGGGDSVAAIQQLDLASRIDHISTGGGASLEFLEGKTLPGIAAIPEAE
ncbi:MAG: phosphoglycerate kinase [Chloroflexia bacterium]|nr:phosphoglycerate kinase [Chloroflexia bacterium]